MQCMLWLYEGLSANFIILSAWDTVRPWSSWLSFSVETYVCHLYRVGRNLLSSENNAFWFSLLYWAKWGFVCYLDGKSASFHYYLSRDIKMKLLCNHTRLNLKSPTVWFVLTLCLLILTMKLAMLECKDNEIHILWFYSYLSRQQQEYLFSSRPF